MTLNKDTKILIVGLGVIGGGFAAALTASGYDVSCITKNREDIEYALERKSAHFSISPERRYLSYEYGFLPQATDTYGD